MLADLIKVAVPNPGTVAVGSTFTLGAPLAGFQGFDAGLGASGRGWLTLSDGAGRALVLDVTLGSSGGVVTATVNAIVFNLRTGTAAGETFASNCVAWCGAPSDQLRFGGAGLLPTVGGTANARTLSYAPAARVLRPDMTLRFVVPAAGENTAADPTLNVSGLGATVVKRADGAALAVGELRGLCTVVFDGTVFRLLAPPNENVGMVAHFASNSAPAGWLKANGALVSRASFPGLWAFAQASGNIVTDATWLAGTVPGAFSQGDGSTTFRVPDLRGEFARGWDDGRGVDSGRGIGTGQQQQIPNHQHVMPFGWDSGSYFSWLDVGNVPIFGSVVNSGATRFSFGTGGTGTGGRFAYTSTAIDNSSGENRPRNVALLACIKF